MPSAIGRIKNWLFKEKEKSIEENFTSFPEVSGTPTKIRRSIEKDGSESLGLNFSLETESPPRKISEHSSLAPRELISPPPVDVDDFDMEREDGFLNHALRAIKSEPVLADDEILEKACIVIRNNVSRPTLVIETVMELRERMHCPKCKADVKRKAGKTGSNSKLWCSNKSCGAAISHLDILHQVPSEIMKAILVKIGERAFLDLLRKVPDAKVSKLEELSKVVSERQQDIAYFFANSKPSGPVLELPKLGAEVTRPEAKAPLEKVEPAKEKPLAAVQPLKVSPKKIEPRAHGTSPTKILQRPKSESPGSSRADPIPAPPKATNNPYAPLQQLDAGSVVNLILARPEYAGLSRDDLTVLLWDKLQEIEKLPPQRALVNEEEIPEPRPKPQSRLKTAPFYQAAMQGKKELATRTEKAISRNKPITKREALKVIDTPATYRPPPLETIHIKGFRLGQISNIKKIFREAGVSEGEARDFDFIGNDILEIIVIKQQAELIISKVNTLCQKSPERFKHLNVHQIQFDCLDPSNIRRNDIVATPKELLMKRLDRKIARLEEGVKKYPFLNRTLNYVKKQHACGNLNIQHKESIESNAPQVRQEAANDSNL